MDEIKKFLGSKNLVMGTKETFKAIKSGTIKKVFLSKNAPKDIREDIEYYKNISDFEVEDLSLTNEEVGTFCKKSFSISVLAIVK